MRSAYTEKKKRKRETADRRKSPLRKVSEHLEKRKMTNTREY